MSKVALITGVTGQDGSYLAEFLLEKGTVWLSLFVVAFNRARRGEFNKMKRCLNVMFNFKRNKGSKCH